MRNLIITKVLCWSLWTWWSYHLNLVQLPLSGCCLSAMTGIILNLIPLRAILFESLFKATSHRPLGLYVPTSSVLSTNLKAVLYDLPLVSLVRSLIFIGIVLNIKTSNSNYRSSVFFSSIKKTLRPSPYLTCASSSLSSFY